MATLILMPRLSPTMEEGVLAKWTRKVGDKIAPGDVIAEVETDKANMDFPLEDEGVLLQLLVKEGDTVKLGAPVAVLGQAGEDPATATAGVAAKPAAEPAADAAPPEADEPPGDKSPADAKAPAADAPEAKKPEPKTPAVAATAKPATVVKAVPAPSGNGRVLASPYARKVARERGIDIASIAGTGPRGRIVSRDLAGDAPMMLRPVVAPVADVLVPASPMRKTIARRLVEAKAQIPHIYLTGEATVDKLLELRAELNALRPEGKISVNDLIVKAFALALRAVPDANVSWTGDGIMKHGRVDVGIAVSLPDGLITPIVRDADRKTLAAMSVEIKALAERGRHKKLKPDEYTGGTATVSNLGMFRVREFEAIINPPESVILAVGTTEKRPMVVERGGADTIVVAQRMTLTLSCDHRTVDGVVGAQLLGKLIELLERPLALVL